MQESDPITAGAEAAVAGFLGITDGIGTAVGAVDVRRVSYTVSTRLRSESRGSAAGEPILPPWTMAPA